MRLIALAALLIELFFVCRGDNSDELTSQCSATLGCPRSSMAWASGTFTQDGILTPQALALNTQLTLHISLCCGYQFHGGMLLDTPEGEALYDAFLETLLHATPLRIFTLEEKRRLLPRASAVISDTRRNKRYSLRMIAQVEDAGIDDGDGDVLLLTTGPVDDAVRRIPFKKGATDDDIDVQLMLSNRILKCKCPHTLHVMPMLRLHQDRVPQPRVLGAGARCVSAAELLEAAGTTSNRQSDDDVAIVHHLTSDTPLPQYAHVMWEVYNVHPEWRGGKSRGGANVELIADPLSSSPPLLLHRRWVTVGLPSSALGDAAASFSRVAEDPGDANETTISPDGISFSFRARIHTRYKVFLRVVKGDANADAVASLVLRAKVLEQWRTVAVPVQPFVGYRYPATIVGTSPASTKVNDVGDVATLSEMLRSSQADFSVYWSSSAVSPGSQITKAVRTSGSSNESTTHVLVQRGGQLLSLSIVDSDEACPPVVIEQHHVYAIQLVITSPAASPHTACANETRLEARDERSMLLGELQQLLLADPLSSLKNSAVHYGGSELLAFNRIDIDAEEWCCSQVSQHIASTLGEAISNSASGDVAARALNASEHYIEKCTVTPQSPQQARIAAMDTRSPAVAGVQWRMRLRLGRRNGGHDQTDEASISLRLFESSWYGHIVSSSASTLVIDVYSRPVMLYRRTAALPVAVDVVLPMHVLEWQVAAPNDQVRGRWSARSPLTLNSAANAPTVLLGTSQVPNAIRTLPRASLQFIVTDSGELVSLPAVLLGWLLLHRRGVGSTSIMREQLPPMAPTEKDSEGGAIISFVARCPDAPVEYNVHVVAFPPPPVDPSHELILTERSHLFIAGPRAPMKGEDLVWSVEHCSVDSIPESLSITSSVASGGAKPTSSPGATLSGVVPHTHCDVRWSVRNAAGAANKTFSIRRCEQPPPLRFSTAVRRCDSGEEEEELRMTPVLRPLREQSHFIAFSDEPLPPSVTSDDRVAVLLPFAGHNNFVFATFAAESPRSRFSAQWSVTDTWDISLFLVTQCSTATSPRFAGLWNHNATVVSSGASSSSVHVDDLARQGKDVAGVKQGLRFLIDSTARRGLVSRFEFVETTAPRWMDEPYASDMAAFDHRLMCGPRTGHVYTLQLFPTDLVKPTTFDQPTGLPVIEMCADSLLIARHPSLFSVYGFTWDWVCSLDMDDVTNATGTPSPRQQRHHHPPSSSTPSLRCSTCCIATPRSIEGPSKRFVR